MVSRWKHDKGMLKKTKDGFADFARSMKIRNNKGAKPRIIGATRIRSHKDWLRWLKSRGSHWLAFGKPESKPGEVNRP